MYVYCVCVCMCVVCIVSRMKVVCAGVCVYVCGMKVVYAGVYVCMYVGGRVWYEGYMVCVLCMVLCGM